MSSFWRFFLAVAVAVGAIAAMSASASAASRVALVVGNSAYKSGAVLDNPANDAADIGAALDKIGFEVIVAQNVTRETFVKDVRAFSERAQGAEIAFLFYAGHGLQMNGDNYLLPVDAKIEGPGDVRFNTISMADIQQEMEGGARTNIIVLDACRNNPFVVKVTKGERAVAAQGLGRVDAAGEGSLIVYSTQPNNVALDGEGRNSPFTAALLKHIATPGLEVRQMISRVRGDVLAATVRRQMPWDSSSLVGDVYLAGSLDAPAPAASQVATGSPDARAAPRVAALMPTPERAADAPVAMPPPPSASAPKALQDVHRFDGKWIGTIDCEPTASGLPGWKYELPAIVWNGHFRGAHGKEGSPGSDSFDGTINPDGSAEISQNGISGPTAKDPFHRPMGTVFQNVYFGGFDGTHGALTRLNRTSCTLNMVVDADGSSKGGDAK